MKKILSSFFALFTILLFETNFVFADEIYYRNYTFDQFYAMEDDELNRLLQECRIYGLHRGKIRFFFYDNEKAKCADTSNLDEFCDILGIPGKYVNEITYDELEYPYIGFYDSNLEEIENGIEFYREYDLLLYNEYSGLDDASQKLINIIYMILYLNPDIYVATEDCLSFEYNDNTFFGDINLDGKINICDAVLLNQAVTNSFVLDENTKNNADCNCDGIVDAKDTICLLRFLVSLTKSLPEIGE